MKYNEDRFQQISYGTKKSTSVLPYKGPVEKLIENGTNVKGLGVIIMKN